MFTFFGRQNTLSKNARVKIIVCFAAVIALVSVPYSTMIYTVGAVFFLLFIILWLCNDCRFLATSNA